MNFRVTEYAHPKKDNGKPNTAAPKEANQVYEDAIKTTFPKNAPIPIETGVSPLSFKAKFLKLVANRDLLELPRPQPGRRHRAGPAVLTSLGSASRHVRAGVRPIAAIQSAAPGAAIGTGRWSAQRTLRRSHDGRTGPRRPPRGRPRRGEVGVLPVFELPRRRGGPGRRAGLHRGERRERLVWPDRLRRADGRVRRGARRGAEIEAIAVACVDAPEGSGPEGLMPCGACRQVLAEFAGPETPVVVDRVGRMTLADLLPHAFRLR